MIFLLPMKRLTFSSAPGAFVVRRPRKMDVRSGTSLIFHFVAYRYHGAALRRGGPLRGIVTPSKRACTRRENAAEEVKEEARANWRQRRTLYCNWGDILEILRR